MSAEKKPASKLARFFGFGDKTESSAEHAEAPVQPETKVLPETPEPADSSDELLVDQSPATLESEQERDIGHLVEESSQPELDGQLEAAVDEDVPSTNQQSLSVETTEATSLAAEPATDKKGLFARWRSGLGKTRQGLGSAFGSLLGGRRDIDEELIEELETALLMADVGIDTTAYLVDALKQKVKKDRSGDQDLMQVFRDLLTDMLKENARGLDIGGRQPNVVMMVGVNGVGKTTSIGKLAKRLQQQGNSVMLAAGDTFRAAAVEQLQVWGERNQIPVVAQSTGSDSASVIYDALHSAQAKNANVLIADTAGRLHNKSNLMEELGKVVRVLKKLDESAPHEILLVLDAATGQNALSQAKEFCKTVPVTGLILTKLDGTAKGGVIFSLVQQLGLPVKFVGLGEGIDDLTEFDPEQFVHALFETDNA